MNSDTNNKRSKFIGKVHSLLQEFGFLDHNMVFDMMNIYASSFYGSNLWGLDSSSTEKIFTSWNKMVRLVWNLPNTTHRYLIEEISKKPHLKASLCQRYLVFVNSLRNSKKDCVSSLAKRVCSDQNSITKNNLNLIEKESNCIDILSLTPSYVSSQVKYAPVPIEEIWRVSLLEELIQIRSHDFILEGFSKEEIDHLIAITACS